MFEGYETLLPKKNYTKPSKLKDGDNKIRIVLPPVGGWVAWENNKPIRSRYNEKPNKANYEKVDAFWACYIWDYDKKDLYVMEISQMGLIKTLTSLYQDPDFGDLTGYDLKITKEGSGQQSRYRIMAMPPKPMSQEIKDAMDERPVRLEALFEGGDPWEDLEPSDVNKSTGESANGPDRPLASPRELLISMLEHDNYPIEHLNDYLKDLSEKSKKPIDELIVASFDSKNQTAFKKSYNRFVLNLKNP